MISRDVIFHENAIFKANLQENENTTKTEKFHFKVEDLPGHNSQGTLDEISDQEETQSTPPSQQSTGSQRQADVDADSPLRSVNQLFQIDDEED